MAGRIFGAGIALALVTVLALPFGREIYYRYEVWRHLDRVADASHRAAFDEWNGSAREFERRLAERCHQLYGARSPACERYRGLED